MNTIKYRNKHALKMTITFLGAPAQHGANPDPQKECPSSEEQRAGLPPVCLFPGGLSPPRISRSLSTPKGRQVVASSPSRVARPPWGSPAPFLKALAVAIQVRGSVLVPRTSLCLTYFHRLPLLPLCSAAKHTSGQSPGVALFACEGAG